MPNQELHALAKDLSNRSRKAKAFGSKVLIPKKYDAAGNIPDVPLPPIALNLKESKFLKACIQANWVLEKALEVSEVDKEWAKRFFSSPRCNALRDDAAHDAFLAQIPSVDYIKARHVENVMAGGEKLSNSAQDSLKELRAIVAPKVSAATGNTFNFFGFGSIPEDVKAQVRALADREASINVEPTV